MEGAEIVHPPSAASAAALARGLQAPTVYWDAGQLVALTAIMMVLFICSAVCFLAFKVQEAHDECEDSEFEMIDEG
jgi:hypothetical protein